MMAKTLRALVRFCYGPKDKHLNRSNYALDHVQADWDTQRLTLTASNGRAAAVLRPPDHRGECEPYETLIPSGALSSLSGTTISLSRNGSGVVVDDGIVESHIPTPIASVFERGFPSIGQLLSLIPDKKPLSIRIDPELLKRACDLAIQAAREDDEEPVLTLNIFEPDNGSQGLSNRALHWEASCAYGLIMPIVY